MLSPPFSFDDIMEPLGAERFLAEYENQKPLHLPGAADKFAEVMSWAKLDKLLDQTSIWSKESLRLMLDKVAVPPGDYCSSGRSRDGVPGLLPDPDKVQELIRRGATLIANDIGRLNPGLYAFTKAMHEGLGAKVDANLYMSSRRRPGFASHFDAHDVYAVQAEGTKTWYVYENRSPTPIHHPRFEAGLGQAHHDRAKDEVMMEVQMTPGDLLYLPRGWYHDALADDGGTMHIAFGAVYMVGLDVVGFLHERLMSEPEVRTDLPRGDVDEGRALADYLAELGDRIAAVLRDPKTVARIRELQRGTPHPSARYDLQDLVSQGAGACFRVRSEGVRLVQQGGRYGLVKAGSRKATEVPSEVGDMVGWVLRRREFSRVELARAFPERHELQLDRLLRELGTMRLTEPL